MEGKDCLPLLVEWVRNGQAPSAGLESTPELPPGTPVGESGGLTQGSADLRQPITVEELQWAIKRMDSRTATGCDGLPCRLLKLLGTKMLRLLAEALLAVLESLGIPPSWCVSRVKPLYKGAGDKWDPANYRPISITPVLYRVTTQILGRRLQLWVETEGILGCLQNGFRRDRRIDNLFVLTQCLEVALQEGRPLLAAFLDLLKAYDSVDRRCLGSAYGDSAWQKPMWTLLRPCWETSKWWWSGRGRPHMLYQAQEDSAKVARSPPPSSCCTSQTWRGS